MLIKGLNHLALITDDMTKTVRFYRDLLGMTLKAGIGHEGYRHYFFQMGTGQVSPPCTKRWSGHSVTHFLHAGCLVRGSGAVERGGD